MPKLFRNLSISHKLIASCSAILLASFILFGWIIYAQWQSSAQQQADALGETLIRQTAKEAMIALAAEDTLGLNILLRELVNNPYVSHAALYSTDNTIITQSGKRPSANDPNHRLYSHQLTFQRVLAGSIQAHIDIGRLQQPMLKSLQSIAALAVLVLVAALYAIHQLARSIRQPIQTLKYWVENPMSEAPHAGRADEIGQLAQVLDALLAPPVLEDNIEEEPVSRTAGDTKEPNDEHLDIMQLPDGVLDTSAPTPAHEKTATATIVLAVQLNLHQQQDPLSNARLAQLLDNYNHALNQAAELYKAELIQLSDGRALLLFDDLNEHCVRYSLCCGELLRAFGHSLQVDIADSGLTVGLQLGVSYGPAITEFSAASLLAQDSVNSALELSQFSRNLLLLSNELAADSRAQACARIRSISRPEGANCVERLLAPYPTQLDQQLLLLIKQ